MSAWNPADKAAGITLSGTNHIATGSGGNNSVRGATSHNTGQWYFEMNTMSFGGAGSGRFGVADGTQGLTTSTMSNAIGGDPGNNFNDGFNSTVVAFGATIVGHILSIAVDLNLNRAWGRIDAGSWVGNGVGAGDPVAGTNGAVISARAGALFPFAFLQNAGNVTYNGGDSAFSETMPTGYTAWENVPPPPIFRRPLVIF